METTKLKLQDSLPLTCSRAGTCCHGNNVNLNPWELFCLAREKGIKTNEFRDLYTDFGGILLLFNGKTDKRGKNACSQYITDFGCSVHLGRPLACRLFPIGRQIQNNEIQYIHQGKDFPCFNGCPEVKDLPHLTVAEYLNGQETESFEQGQDHYLELMQNLADMSFELYLDTGLAASGETKTLQSWKEMGHESPDELAKRIGTEWMDYLMIPEIESDTNNSILFVQNHSDLLQQKIADSFGSIATNQEFHEASNLLMGLALHLARGIGARPEDLADHWCKVATELGKEEGR